MRDVLRIGKIISLHGIKGEIKIFSTSDELRRYDKLKNFYLGNNQDGDDIEENIIYEVQSVKYVKNNPILKIKGYDSIEESTSFIGKSIFVDRKDAIELKENEYFIIDLIGIDVFVRNEKFGTVVDCLKNKANDIIVVKHNDKEVLIPLVADFIEKINIESKCINVKTVEGLL